jgi:hypothetical protein
MRFILVDDQIRCFQYLGTNYADIVMLFTIALYTMLSTAYCS